MEQNEATYTNGFNNGYLLAKYEPSLLEQVLKQLAPSSEYLEGLFSGREEYQREYTRTQLDGLSRLRDNTQDRDREVEMS
jgi:hypothetical protein